MAVLSPIKAKAAATDDLIDEIVYKLLLSSLVECHSRLSGILSSERLRTSRSDKYRYHTYVLLSKWLTQEEIAIVKGKGNGGCSEKSAKDS
jgi:hypothetical protein